MRSKEVEKAINKLMIDKNFVLSGCSTAIININNIETLLAYISELEEKVEKYNKQLDLDYVDNNFVSKDVIRDKIKEIEKIQNKCAEITFDEIILKLEELLGEGDK